LLTTFIQDAAHEFRTPLTTIGSSSYLIVRSDDQAHRARKAAQIELSIQRITRLVDMLTLMASLENGDAPLPGLPVDVVKVLNDVCEGATDNLTVAVPHDLPHIMGNGDQLTTALAQIIDNACRFTPATGTIRLVAGTEPEHIWITVRDAGPGISAEALPHIFKTFWRQDGAHTTPGLGLGLPIARRIIEAHGGTIDVTSIDGQGTTVRVRLPLADTPPT
jgi:signal transduction histidine kinase